jgi:hypothetical protein
MWLDNDPREAVSEDMPLTLQMMTDLCSVDRDDLPIEERKRDVVYSHNVLRHTFTCTKRGEKRCRFNIPHWPLPASLDKSVRNVGCCDAWRIARIVLTPSAN